MATAVFDDRPREAFQWTRSSAISVTLAAHALAALLILAPPAMETVEKRENTAVEPIVLIPEKKEEIVQPVEPLKVKPFVPKTKPVPRPETPPAPPMPVEANDSPMAVPVDPAPPAPDPGPASIPETAPTALGYGAGMKKLVYPRDAIKNRQEGTVMLRVKIGTDGAPLEAIVETSSGHASLDRAAREAVMKWRSTPGTKNGQPYIAWGLVPISFKLNQL
ncbi:MAG TPA: TonB family protein [Tahibacter sp.]|nr:TonB family protein [Tahibacter sp.]